MAKKYTANYIEIDQMVVDYKNNQEGAAEQLIETFKPFLYKYVRMIKSTHLDFYNKDSRKFIMLFVEDPAVRKKLIKSRQSSEVRRDAHIAVKILTQACWSLTEEDIYHESIATLLTLARRFEQKGKKNFCGYLYNAFRYEFFRRIIGLTKDPVAFSSMINTQYSEVHDNGEPVPDIAQDTHILAESPYLLSEDYDILDNNWVQGHTCSDEFATLTNLERLILQLSYQDGLSDTAIAEKTGFHRHTIREKKLEAIDKIAKLKIF